jgi:hypothetical protein
MVFSYHPSVGRRDLPQRLRRPAFNRCYARLLHLGVSVFDASTTHHQRLLHRYHGAYPVKGPVCNSDLFQGPF